MEKKITFVRVVSSPWLIIINLLSVMISWFYNHSILWAIFHYWFGFIYFIYSLLLGRLADGKLMEIIHYYF